MRPLYLLAITLTAGSLASLSACTINGGTSAPPSVPPPAPMPDVNAAPIATPAPVVTAPPATTAVTPVVTAPPAYGTPSTVTPPPGSTTAPPARPIPTGGVPVIVQKPGTPMPAHPIGVGPTAPVGATNGACSTDADCRIFSDYCTGCDCRVLARSQANPTCKTPGVRCLMDPCRDAKPVCAAGACTMVKGGTSTQ